MHIVKLLQAWLIETEGNIGVLSYLGQGGLCSLSASAGVNQCTQLIDFSNTDISGLCTFKMYRFIFTHFLYLTLQH